MVLGASTDWFTQSTAAPIGWFQQLTTWAHSSILNEPWFQNLILAFSAATAIWTISSSSRHERRRATVDIARDQEKDEVLLAARAVIRRLKKSAAPGKIDFDPMIKQKDSAQLRAIFTVLNSYEFMANGVQTGAFDETTYKRVYFSTVIDHWALFQDFVEKYRKEYEEEYRKENNKEIKADTLYRDFETLATKWSKQARNRSMGWRGFILWRWLFARQAPTTLVKPSSVVTSTAPAQTQTSAQAPAPVQPKPTAPPPPPSGTSI